MRFNYEFSNLCGSVYKQGNLVFTPDGNSVLSPVGNRISVFDLAKHTCVTLPFENHKDIAHLCLAPNGSTLLSIDVEGRALLVNFYKRVVLGQFHFQKPVRHAQFSPDSKYVAVTHGTKIQVWHAPPLVTEHRPFVLLRSYAGHYDDVTCIEWSPDSKFFVTGSRDMTVRVWSLHPVPGYKPVTLTGHRGLITGCYFGPTPTQLFTVSKDGATFQWDFRPDRDGRVAAHVHRQAVMGKRKAAAGRAAAGGAKRRRRAGEELDEDGVVGLSDDDEDEEEEDSDSDAGSSSSSSSDSDSEEGEDDLNTAELLEKLPFLARGRFVLAKKHYFRQDHAKVVCSALYRPRKAAGPSSALAAAEETVVADAAAEEARELTGRDQASVMGDSSSMCLLVVGFDSGVFALYELPDFTHIHSLSISKHRVSTVSVNASGEWLAFGSARLGQLLVWEWRSETYVLKQQGHFFDVTCVAYSPDGQLAVTGGDDGKVKLWNTTTGFCFVTFDKHAGPVTAVDFSGNGTVVFSASLDGTVRAYDLVRYRNFRVLKAPTPVQFMSLAAEPSGDIVCAGAMDPHHVYVWSLRTGELLETLAGHEGPVVSLSYNPTQALLASASWDKTVRVWDVFTRKASVETLKHSTDALSVAWRPDGKELCSSALDGQLYFWDAYEGKLKHTIEGKRDVRGGRLQDDTRDAKSSSRSTAFTSLCYSADGTCVLAGGNSMYACIYEVKHKILLRKFQITHNRSLDGVTEKLNSKYMSESGSLKTIDDSDSDDSDGAAEDRRAAAAAVPGARRGDLASRTTRLAARTRCVRFSPTGAQFAAASTEGLLLYSLDRERSFDPRDLDMEVTPDNARRALAEHHFSKALVMSLRLGEKDLLAEVMERTPPGEVGLVARSVPEGHLQQLLRHVAEAVEASPHLEFNLRWVRTLLATHGRYLQTHASELMQAMRATQRSLTGAHKDLARVCNENRHMLQYLVTFPSHAKVASAADDDN